MRQFSSIFVCVWMTLMTVGCLGDFEAGDTSGSQEPTSTETPFDPQIPGTDEPAAPEEPNSPEEPNMPEEPSTPEEPAPPTEPPPAPTGTWDLTGNPNYNVSARTWKNGARITGEALEALIGLEWWRNNPSQHMDGNTNSRAGSDNLYILARTVRDRMQAMLLAFRLTGDLRFLDTTVGWLEIAKTNLKVGYSGHDKSKVTWSPSPFRCWRAYVGASQIDGTDLSSLNEVKWHTAIAEITWALYLNRDHYSPAGHNYRNLYTYWRNYLLNDFTPKWSGGGTEGWRAEYRGVRKDPTFSPKSPGKGPMRYGRAKTGEWPIIVNGGDLHSTQSSALLGYYMGLITGNQLALNESQWIVDRFKTQDSFVLNSARLFSRSPLSHGGNGIVALGATYASYIMMDYTTLYLEGQHMISNQFMRELAETVQSRILISGVTSNSSTALLTYPHVTGATGLGGLTVGSYTGRTQLQVALKPYFVPARWSRNDTLVKEARRLLIDKSWAGTVEKPRSPMLNAALLLNAAPL